MQPDSHQQVLCLQLHSVGGGRQGLRQERQQGPAGLEREPVPERNRPACQRCISTVCCETENKVCVCVHACVRACVRAFMRVCVYM